MQGCEREVRYRSILEDIDEGYFEIDRRGASTLSMTRRPQSGLFERGNDGMSYWQICDPKSLDK